MKRPHELQPHELVEIVDAIQQTLYLDYRPGAEFFWNPVKEWDCVDALDAVALKLNANGLVPHGRKPFQPGDSSERP